MFPAISRDKVKCAPSDALLLIFGDDIQRLQGDHIAAVYRQVADVLPLLSDEIHRVFWIVQPPQLLFPVLVTRKIIQHLVGIDATVCCTPDPMPQADDSCRVRVCSCREIHILCHIPFLHIRIALRGMRQPRIKPQQPSSESSKKPSDR